MMLIVRYWTCGLLKIAEDLQEQEGERFRLEKEIKLKTKPISFCLHDDLSLTAFKAGGLLPFVIFAVLVLVL